MQRFSALMDEGRYRIAEDVAFEAQKVLPDSLTALDATMTSRQIGYLVQALGLRVARQKGVIDALTPVEKTLIPFNDDNPIVYPDADVWRELTARRKEKYSQMDLAGSKPAEQKINKVLHDQTELDFVDTPLADVITYLQDYHKINITIDHKAAGGRGNRDRHADHADPQGRDPPLGVETDVEGFGLDLRDRRRGASDYHARRSK